MDYNLYMTKPRPHPDMTEGPEAFERFRQAAKIALSMPGAPGFDFETWAQGATKPLSSPQSLPKPPKIFIPIAIKNSKSWRDERGQLDKIELVGKERKQCNAE